MKKFFSTVIVLFLLIFAVVFNCFAQDETTETQSTQPEKQIVAKIGNIEYETLAEAVKAVPCDRGKTTITLCKDATGDGVVIKNGQNIILDFNGKTYTVGDADSLVGSQGTISQTMQILKGSMVQLKNGTLTSEKAGMIVQNYGNLTLDNMILDGSQSENCRYTLSNNCGKVVVKNHSGIIGDDNTVAFDLWYGLLKDYYEGVSVTFDESFDGEVVGNIEYGADASVTDENWTDYTSLIIKGGNFNSQFISSDASDTGFDISKANITILGGSFKGNVYGFAVGDTYLNEQGLKGICNHLGKIEIDITDSCSAFGIRVYVYCSGCGKEFAKLTLGKNHSYSKTVKTVNATCRSIGYTVKQCDCGVKDYEIHSVIPHSFNDGVVTKKATCVSKGVKTYTCIYESCGATKTQEIAINKSNHANVVTDKAVSATCTSQGLTEGKHCEGCEAVITAQQKTDKLSHKWDEGAVTQKATCVAKGTKKYTCTSCSATKTEEIAINKSNHANVVTDKAVSATCTSQGLTEGKHCEGCEAVITAQQKTDKLSHKWDDGTVTKKATCVAKGTKEYTCTFCDATKAEEIDVNKNNHSLKSYSAKAPTCTEGGWNAYKKCARKACGYTTYEAKKALGHKWSSTGAQCTVCLVEDTPKKIIKVQYSKQGVDVGSKWQGIDLIVEVKYNKHTATLTYKDIVRSPIINLNKPGVYEVPITYRGIKAEKGAVFTVYPAKLKKLSAKTTSSTISLSWDESKGATGYRVYRYSSGKWVTVIRSTTALNCKITKLSSATKYTFAVRPYYKSGSTTVWASKYTKIELATSPATPTLKLASTAKGKVTAAWTNVSGENGYELYYAESKNGTYKKVATYKANATKGTKSSLKSKKYYYFKVRAYKTVSSTKVYSSYSKVVSIKTK